MNAEELRQDFQLFEQCEVVDKPYVSCPGRYEGLLRAVMNLNDTKAIKLPLVKYNMDRKAAMSLLSNLRTKAKKLYQYRLGGTIKDSDLFVWRNPN